MNIIFVLTIGDSHPSPFISCAYAAHRLPCSWSCDLRIVCQLRSNNAWYMFYTLYHMYILWYANICKSPLVFAKPSAYYFGPQLISCLCDKDVAEATPPSSPHPSNNFFLLKVTWLYLERLEILYSRKMNENQQKNRLWQVNFQHQNCGSLK